MFIRCCINYLIIRFIRFKNLIANNYRKTKNDS